MREHSAEKIEIVTAELMPRDPSALLLTLCQLLRQAERYLGRTLHVQAVVELNPAGNTLTDPSCASERLTAGYSLELAEPFVAESEAQAEGYGLIAGERGAEGGVVEAVFRGWLERHGGLSHTGEDDAMRYHFVADKVVWVGPLSRRWRADL